MEQVVKTEERLYNLGNSNQVRFRETLMMIDERFAFKSFDQIAAFVTEYCEKPVADIAICYLLGQAIVDISDTFNVDEPTVIRCIAAAASDIGRGAYGVAFQPNLRVDTELYSN